MYLLACFYYVWLEMEKPTLPKVQLLMNEESRILDEETGQTELEKRMNTLAVRSLWEMSIRQLVIIES